jgi:hypothetical protein
MTVSITIKIICYVVNTINITNTNFNNKPIQSGKLQVGLSLLHSNN